MIPGSLGLRCGGRCVGDSLGFVFSLRMDDLVRRSLTRLPGMRLRATLGGLLDALQAYRTKHGMLVWVLVASVAVQRCESFKGGCWGAVSASMRPSSLMWFVFP